MMTEEENRTAKILKKHLVDDLEREIEGKDKDRLIEEKEKKEENPKLEASLKKADIIVRRDD